MPLHVDSSARQNHNNVFRNEAFSQDHFHPPKRNKSEFVSNVHPPNSKEPFLRDKQGRYIKKQLGEAYNECGSNKNILKMLSGEKKLNQIQRPNETT